MPTVWDLADAAGWDGTGPIRVYAELEPRVFDVHYIMYGYEDEHAFDIDRQLSWFDHPVDETVVWKGHLLDEILDDEFNVLDSSMTCGDIWLAINYDYPILYYPDDALNIEYVWITLDYTVSLYYPNGIRETLSVLYPQEIHFPTSGDGFDYPGYDFAGWFTQPDGAGEQIIDGRQYSDIIPDDSVRNLDLYAYFVPSADSVTLVYWSFTNDHPIDDGAYAEVRRVTVRLTDPFDFAYDPNKDDDTANHYLSHRITGWYDEWWAEFYNQQWVDNNGFVPTIQWIADYIEWDGTSDINVYADVEMRVIKVTYVADEFVKENSFDTVEYISWNVSPYASGLRWFAHELLSQTDEWGQEIDSSMTCGDVLLGIHDESSDSLTIYLNWVALSYNVTFCTPNGILSVLTIGYLDEIIFPQLGIDFSYPGYDLVGWYTEPNGGGNLVEIGAHYNNIERFDSVTERTLYAYLVPSASKPQDAVSAALQLASMQATAFALADSVQMDAVNGLAADDITSSVPLYPAAACAASTYEMIAGSAAGHTVCPAQTMQAVLPSVTRRVA